MAVRTSGRQLPYRIGVWGIGEIATALVLLVLLAVGAFAYSLQLTQGDIVTGMRDWGTMGGAPWGLYIAFELYFAGVGLGALLLIGIIRLSNTPHLQSLARPAGLLAVVTLIAGVLAVLVDLGQPWRGIINLLRYARPESPFFGTFTVGVATSLIGVLVYLYLDSRRDAYLLSRLASPWQGFLRMVSAGYKDTPAQQRRHSQVTLVLALGLLALGLLGASTSGFVFGTQAGRPGWFSTLQAVNFVVLALATATGMLLALAVVFRRFISQGLQEESLIWLANATTALASVAVYFYLVETLSTAYASPEAEAGIMEVLLKGSYAWLFWLTGALFLLVFLVGLGMFGSRRYPPSLLVALGILVNLAAIGKRYLIVVPSLTHGALLPYPSGSYSPTWVEYMVVIGIFALGGLMFLGFMKVFPIMRVQESE